ncbi:prepilin peptidase [Ferrimonas balearica]|uniref:A24 family peptidase n=1 Tax=Ferrimonas balearica TaxID=44012 RepID=UPI001C98F0AE|nr:A24 family peptidase [Ferrimonas balearica]MBY5992040.1 A24 family peptidase [Ferrimonas balearica]
MSSFPPNDDPLSWMILAGFALALVSDIRTQRIPNLLFLAALICGVAYHSLQDGWAGLGTALGGTLVALLLLPLYLKKFIGAGDVKFMMGMGALMGPTLTLWVLALGVASGALVAPLLALNQVGWKGLVATFKRYYQCAITRTYFRPEQGEAAAARVPYAPALAAGWLLTQFISFPGL